MLHALYQKTRVSSNVNELRNIVISISGIREDEKLDKFCAGSKPMIGLEVLKAGPVNLEQAVGVP